MSERVITTTIQITKVYRDVPECFDLDKEVHADNYKQITEDAFKDENVDSVVVTNVHEVELQGLRDQMDDEIVLGDEECKEIRM